MNKKELCLITGATGFIGSFIAEQLKERGFDVRCTVRKTSNLRWLEGKGFDLVEASLSDPRSLKKAVHGVDYVFHCAGLTAAKNLEGFLRGNRDGTRNLLNAVKDNAPGIKRFLYVSSQTVCGPSPALDAPVDEESICKPITSYGKSKLAAEKEVLKEKENLKITIVRPPAVYGPRDTASFDIFKVIESGLAANIGFRPKYASIIHAEDLARGIIDAALSDVTVGKTYFVSSEDITTWGEIYKHIQDGLGKKRVLNIKLPHFLVLTVAGISGFFGKFSAKPPVFNYEKGIDFIQEYWTCSSANAAKDFGFRQQIPLREGLIETARWYIDNGWIKKKS